MKTQDAVKGAAVKVVHGFYAGKTGTLIRRESLSITDVRCTIKTNKGIICVGNGSVQPAKARRASYAK
jgi:hypothetical protein